MTALILRCARVYHEVHIMLVVCMPCFALLQRPGSLVVKAAFSAGGAVMNGIYLKVLFFYACMSCARLVLLCFTSLALWLSRLPLVLEGRS